MILKDHVLDASALLPSQCNDDGASRRTALKVALGVGYAAAAAPLMAQTAITTSSEGLTSGEGRFDVAGFSVPFYYAAPQGKKNPPIILVVHEIFGVHAYIADTCRRLAQAGYLAIAPELFARQGQPSKYTEIPKLIAEVVSKVPDAQVLTDLDAALVWAGANGGNLSRVGITGFCYGGRMTWLYAAHNPQVRAGVAWYGRLLGTSSALSPQHPVDVVAKLNGPVLGLYGAQDTGIPLTTVNQMKDALAQAGSQGNNAAKNSQFVVFRDAPHAFHADYRPSYRKQAAEDGFKQAIAWMASHGVK